MLVQFANTWLTNDGSGNMPERAWTSVQQLTIDDKEVVQEAAYIDAAVQDVFDRGNLVCSLGFKVTRNFAALVSAQQTLTLAGGASLALASGKLLTVGGNQNNPIALASFFALTHMRSGGVTRNGPLVITCGGWGETPAYVQAPSAVLVSAKSSFRGVQVTTQYAFRFGLINSFNPATDNPITDHNGTAQADATGVQITD